MPLEELVRSKVFIYQKNCRWLFEKYDGVRGFWNPEKKAFYSRSGRKIRLPQEIVNAMPDNIFLDGELWYDRNPTLV